jgi:hypothetical protein
MTKSKSKFQKSIEWLLGKDPVDGAARGAGALKHFTRDDFSIPENNIDLRSDLVRRHAGDLWKEFAERSWPTDLFDMSVGQEEWMKIYWLEGMRKAKIAEINKEFLRLKLPPLSDDEISGYFLDFPPRDVDELPVEVQGSNPFPVPSDQEQMDRRRGLSKESSKTSPFDPRDNDLDSGRGEDAEPLFRAPRRSRHSRYPNDPVSDVGEESDFGGPGGFHGEGFNPRPSHGGYDIDPIDPNPDIGADGDFGGSGGYRGDGRYNPPTSGDDFNPGYEPDDDDNTFDPVPDVGVDADFGGAGGYNGGPVDTGNNDVDDDFSGMDMDNWAFPVIIDLDGDGIQIIPVGESRAQFDMDDSGRKQIMAWAGADDALLVFDEDNDRVITTRNEFAFAEYLENARTDLEGLAWFDQFAQGGNEDGVLDERDALWSKFGLWQDANQNGVTDPGELRMSGEGGLQSVNLKSDQRSYEAGPDARVFGRGAYTAQDESGQTRTGDLYDTALRYEENPEPKTAAEIFYPGNPVKLTPEQQGYRRVRKDGQPISDAEIFYPDKSRAHEYTYVRNDTVSQRQKDADLLYDHPTSRPNK